MTVISVDRNSISSDSRGTDKNGNKLSDSEVKIFNKDGKIFGISGYAKDAYTFINSFRFKVGFNIFFRKLNGFSVLVVDNGEYKIYHSKGISVRSISVCPPFTMGSGGKYAIEKIDEGSIEAVRYAIEKDRLCGGDINTIYLN